VKDSSAGHKIVNNQSIKNGWSVICENLKIQELWRSFNLSIPTRTSPRPPAFATP
jgi:hypothetical protein